MSQIARPMPHTGIVLALTGEPRLQLAILNPFTISADSVGGHLSACSYISHKHNNAVALLHYTALVVPNQLNTDSSAVGQRTVCARHTCDSSANAASCAGA